MQHSQTVSISNFCQIAAALGGAKKEKLIANSRMVFGLGGGIAGDESSRAEEGEDETWNGMKNEKVLSPADEIASLSSTSSLADLKQNRN